ncbi:unnamed protein product [Mytilus edulis]|uniref:Uncharacterized protein n=1 Tax=Mytilus edulis TaxID=6550 RepID=A0A8S3U326_MYTED|nr:unnamed protein product [Mytilus edulis]
MPCCDECISTSHSRCKGIDSLASVVEKTNIETYKEFVNKNINSILHHLDELTNNKSPNIKLGENQCKDIKESQVEIKKKINTRFDLLEKKVFGEKDVIFDKEKSQALFLINEIEGKKKRLKEIQDNLNAITTLRKQESFLGVHIIEQQLPPLQRYIENLDDNEIFNTLNKFRSLKSFEEEAIDKTLNKETSMRRKAQVETQEIKYMTVNIESKNEINTGMVIRDMICLIDGRVVLVQWFGNVYLLTSDCSLVTKIPINGKACCVTQINLNTIAISYPNQKAIAIFELENETITKVIIFEKHCYGLSFCDNYLAVCLGNNDICITDLVGNILSSIQVHSESLLWNLVYRNDVLIYSDCSGKAVYCIDLSGKQLWEYKQELVKPAGICTDNYGNIFIADEGSHRITVISQDGHHSKVLVSEEDGLDYPRFICFEYNEFSGFICDCNGEYLAKFNLSYA